MNRDDIISAVYVLWEAMGHTYNLKNPKVPEIEFFSKSAVSGKAYYDLHKVTFNEILALENPETFMNTIAHEIAHLITHQVYPYAKQHHGPEFRSVMKVMGYVPNTYHTYNVESVSTRRVKTRFVYLCKSCGMEHRIAKPTHNKIQVLNTLYKCKCGGYIEFTGQEEKFV